MTLSEDSGSSSNRSTADDTFKILLATDIHLGYNETDKVAGDDSFNTFEEILMLASSRDVDFILLGGDLFHKAQPSANTLNRCITLLRDYTLGDKPINFTILNQNFNMSSGVNFKDPNMNVSFPVFSIHGNHDDTINNLSAMDILSSSGLVNYFGKWQSLQEVTLDPILLQKNRTKIALYGLSHIPDRRLYHLFKEKKIDISIPSDDENEYFNILALHQNRADRGAKNTVTMDLLPKNMNLVLWGHEHDCRIEPEEYSVVGTDGNLKPRYVTQPGSSVATSLCEGEAIEKKVGVLVVHYDRNLKEPVFKINTIPLKTVRPFIFKAIELKNFEDELQQIKGNPKDKIEKFLEQEVEQMIKDSKALCTGHPKQKTLPLIRLRVQFEETDHLLNVKRFGQKFVETVANPGDILLFRKSIKRLKTAKINIDDGELNKAVSKREQVDRVEDVVEKYFNSLTDDRDKMKLFHIKCLSEMSRFIVDKDNCSGANDILDYQLDEAAKFVNTRLKNEDEAPEVIQQYRNEKSLEVLDSSISNILSSKKQSTTSTTVSSSAQFNNSDDEIDDDDDEDAQVKPKAARGRGRGRAAAKTAAAPSTRGRASKANTSTTAAKTTRGRGKNQSLFGTNIAQQLSMRQTQQSFTIDDSD
ncbi:double-strand break repair protein MRE11 [Chironomus tepperi]|uniref:double-strand break repair protein MRE11 n=1 Tax=Chironomus tepperi TaxID=113505 RepID=UPI00391EF972